MDSDDKNQATVDGNNLARGDVELLSERGLELFTTFLLMQKGSARKMADNADYFGTMLLAYAGRTRREMEK